MSKTTSCTGIVVCPSLSGIFAGGGQDPLPIVLYAGNVQVGDLRLIVPVAQAHRLSIVGVGLERLPLLRGEGATLQRQALQGGPFTPEEREAFEANPYYAQAVCLRHWDDQAKIPDLDVPGVEHYRERILAAARKDA